MEAVSRSKCTHVSTCMQPRIYIDVSIECQDMHARIDMHAFMFVYACNDRVSRSSEDGCISLATWGGIAGYGL